MSKIRVAAIALAVVVAGCSVPTSQFRALTVPIEGRDLSAPGQPPAIGMSAGPLHPARLCPPLKGALHCDALTMVTDAGSIPRSSVPIGYTPADLWKAYGLTDLVKTGGVGQTVGVVGAYDNPTLEQDMNHYRATFGLPPCTRASGCFQKFDENGVAETSIPAATGSLGLPGDSVVTIGGEASLDVDMVSAACPNCHIIYVEAIAEGLAAGTSLVSLTDLAHAANTAARLGATVVTTSYSTLEGSDASIPADDHLYNTPGTIQVASTGDGGYGVEYPAASVNVIAVGGTSLIHATNPRGFSEIAWGYAGSGCSSTENKPAWQNDTLCRSRMVADVSAVADPRTPLAVYDTYGTPNGQGWIAVGGTSASSPFIAGLIGLAGNAATLRLGAQYLYQHSLGFRDIQGGQNKKGCGDYTCRGDIGYDGPTGLGTPIGLSGL